MKNVREMHTQQVCYLANCGFLVSATLMILIVDTETSSVLPSKLWIFSICYSYYLNSKDTMAPGRLMIEFSCCELKILTSFKSKFLWNLLKQKRHMKIYFLDEIII